MDFRFNENLFFREYDIQNHMGKLCIVGTRNGDFLNLESKYIIFGVYTRNLLKMVT